MEVEDTKNRPKIRTVFGYLKYLNAAATTGLILKNLPKRTLFYIIYVGKLYRGIEQLAARQAQIPVISYL
jgi:hypothetical protein